MALRDQPYLPLYIQDFLTDEKLIECSASATGVYIRLMCIMHKSEQYGTILLKQKDKQSDKQIINFACKLSRQMPYHVDEIKSALDELMDNNVLNIDGDLLIQKRMVKDCELSEKRALAGKIGGKLSGKKNNFAQAKSKANLKAKDKANDKANSEYENEIENEYEIVNEIENKKNSRKNLKNKPESLLEVQAFFQAEGSDQAEAFFDYFESVDWVIGKSKKPCRDWRAAARNWIRSQGKYQPQKENLATGLKTRPEMIFDTAMRAAENLKQQLKENGYTSLGAGAISQKSDTKSES